jgi:hypothetical protein
MQLRRPAEGQGQPSPAGLEPGPLERSEAERGAADDHQRELLQREARGAGESARAEGIAELAPPRELDPQWLQYLMQSGNRRHTLTIAGQIGAAAEVVQLPFPEEVRAGMLYVMRAIRVQAPAGALLQLYENNVGPTGFREVITAAQEASLQVPGEQVWRGPCRIIAVISKTTAAGLAVVRLEGDLVKREPVIT